MYIDGLHTRDHPPSTNEKVSLDMNTLNAATNATTTTTTYVVKAKADAPENEMVQGMVRLSLARLDGKKGKGSHCIVVPAVSDALLNCILVNPDGREWLAGCIDRKRAELASAAYKKGEVVSSVTIGVDNLLASLKVDVAASSRFTVEAIQGWFGGGLQQLLLDALEAKGMSLDAATRTCDVFRNTFCRLAARKDNFWLTEQEKGQLVKAMALIDENSEYAQLPMTERVAEKLSEIPTSAPVAIADAL